MRPPMLSQSIVLSSSGELEGVPNACVINRDTLLSIPKDAVDTVPLGPLGVIKRRELDQALRYSLDIQS